MTYIFNQAIVVERMLELGKKIKHRVAKTDADENVVRKQWTTQREKEDRSIFFLSDGYRHSLGAAWLLDNNRNGCFPLCRRPQRPTPKNWSHLIVAANRANPRLSRQSTTQMDPQCFDRYDVPFNWLIDDTAASHSFSFFPVLFQVANVLPSSRPVERKTANCWAARFGL